MLSFSRSFLRSPLSSLSSLSSLSPLSPSFSSRSFTSSRTTRGRERGKLVELAELPSKSKARVGSGGVWSWEQRPKTVLIVKREYDEGSSKALLKICDWMERAYPNVKILVDRETYSHEPSLAHLNSFTASSPSLPCSSISSSPLPHQRSKAYFNQNDRTYRLLSERVDVVLSLGGDGTLLRACSLFKKEVPPILAFHMGTLGFMTNAKVDNYKQEIARVMEGNFLCSQRERLLCTLEKDPENEEQKKIDLFRSLNEVAFASGTTRSVVVSLDVSINNQYVTTVQGDGLIVASSTGSTAYSLTCGGPIAHPECKGILLTPIAPRSLSFRPIMLPSNAKIGVTVASDNRYGDISMTFDGRQSMILPVGRSLTVQTSKHRVNVVSIKNSMSDWVSGMKERLKWNS